MDREYIEGQSRNLGEISNRYNSGKRSHQEDISATFNGYRRIVPVIYPDNYIAGYPVSNR